MPLKISPTLAVSAQPAIEQHANASSEETKGSLTKYTTHAESSDPMIVNYRTASVDSDFRPVIDPRVKREIRELQRGETIKLWQYGVDRDGKADRPRAWKLYDPETLPMVYRSQFHDSEGVNGFPGNVILGGRAKVTCKEIDSTNTAGVQGNS
jgi:hypothetical protein